MKTLVTMTISVAMDGDDYHVSDSTQTHGNEWGDVYRGLIMIRDEVARQVASAKMCPSNPKNVRISGIPSFDVDSTDQP